MDAHPDPSHTDIVDAVDEKSRRWPRLFLAALVVGTVIRLAGLQLPGTADMGVWKLWTYGAAVEAPTRLYGIGGAPTHGRGPARGGAPPAPCGAPPPPLPRTRRWRPRPPPCPGGGS